MKLIFSVVLKSDLASGFMQVLLTSMYKINLKITQKVVKKLLKECFIAEDSKVEDSEIEKVFESMASTRYMVCIFLKNGY